MNKYKFDFPVRMNDPVMCEWNINRHIVHIVYINCINGYRLKLEKVYTTFYIYIYLYHTWKRYYAMCMNDTVEAYAYVRARARWRFDKRTKRDGWPETNKNVNRNKTFHPEWYRQAKQPIIFGESQFQFHDRNGTNEKFNEN